MYKIVTNQQHRIIDFATVVIFALAPSLISLNPLAATICYVLALIHLALTIITRFDANGVIPIKIHGAIEAIVAGGLMIASNLAFQGLERIFFFYIGLVIAAVWVFSRYEENSIK